MIARRSSRAAATNQLSESLVALAASLAEQPDAAAVLNRLTRSLTELDIACAVFRERPDGAGFSLDRATLPLVPDVWGRPLLLPRLSAVLARGRAFFLTDIDEVFSEVTSEGQRRPLFTQPVPGALIAAPTGGRAARSGVLCLVSPRLEEHDRAGAWALALQVGATVLAQAAGTVAAEEGDLSIFHELTRRLSYSLGDDELAQAALEVLAPVLNASLAATIICQRGEDAARVYAAGEIAGELASGVAARARDAFLRLTGDQHRFCRQPPYRTATLAIDLPPPGGMQELRSSLEAPLVVAGEVAGLLWVGGADAAFQEGARRTFYTVAHQLSLALERVAAQRRSERAQLASLAESLSDGIVLVDAELRVTALNGAAQELIDGLPDARLAEEARLSGALAALAEEALATRRPTALRELAAAPAPSGRRYLMAMAAPLAGSPEGSAAVVIVRDVTEERLMQERLLQSEKMVSVGQLVSGVAHELNNPLTGIMGFAQLLLARDLDDRTLRDIETIYTEAERASKIVQNLLTFARRKRAEKERADLNALIGRVLELRSYELRVKNIEVVLDLDPHLPETMADTNQIQQVFLNIIINAEQALLAPTGRGAGTLTVRSRREGDVVRISFQDDGPGMEPETLRRIFDPFFTTKETGEGTGLGLTISYGIIDEHGGRIWADSQPGRGTTFFIELPIVQGEARPRAPEEEAPAPALASRSILVVDDEESIQRLLGSILQMDGHRVDTARNGREALDRIAQRPYDVIITDIKMPDMDGRHLYERLREIDAGLAQRTVFITGDTVSPDTRDFLQQVQNPCLAKPFRVREVRETIGQLLAEDK